MAWPLILKPIQIRFKLHGTYTDKQLIRDLQETIKDLNIRLAESETALNELKDLIDAL